MSYEILSEACLKAVKSLGPDIKTMSWFKRSWPKQQIADEATKKAA